MPTFRQSGPRIIQHADCLPQVLYRGRPARIVGTRYWHPDTKESWGKYYDLRVNDHVYHSVHESQVSPCVEEVEPVPAVFAMHGWSSPRLVKS